MDVQENASSTCQYHYERHYLDTHECGGRKRAPETYYSYNKRIKMSCDNASCLDNYSYDHNSFVTSKYFWLINNRYVHFMEHADIKSGCENRKIESYHLSVLNAIVRREKTQNVIIFVDQRRPAKHLLSRAVRNVSLQVLKSIPSHGRSNILFSNL